jgi:uncharacterized repeat protein (TIGR04042 family)
MPEMHFRVRWPSGERERCYSPSLVMQEFFAVGATYRVDDFMRRAREAYGIAQERVRAKYGFGCGHATAQLAHLERIASEFASSSDAFVTMEAFEV